MEMYLPHHHHEHAFWTGQVPMMGPPAQPNQRLSRDQWNMLEQHFTHERKPTTVMKRQIAQTMGVPLEKINNWFQNRRAKERQEQKKAEAAAKDGRPLPESLNNNLHIDDEQTSEMRPASQPIGAKQHVLAVSSSTLPVANPISSRPHSANSSPSAEIGSMVQVMPTSLTPDATFDSNHFTDDLTRPIQSGLPLAMVPSDNIVTNHFYPSPDQTVFSSPEQPFQIMSQSMSTSGIDSPEGLHPVLSNAFSEGNSTDVTASSGPNIPHSLSYLPNESSIPDLAFPDGQQDNILTSAVSCSDFAPFHSLDGISVPATPTFPGGSLEEQFQAISSQAIAPNMSTAADFTTQNSDFLSLFSNDIINNSVSLPTTAEGSPVDHVMPPPDVASLFKPRQSSQPNIAARRRKAAPSTLNVGPVVNMARSGSYTAGMPLSPRSPLLGAPDQTLRRIKSSTNTAGRVQKPMTPAQRSPMLLSFAHHNQLHLVNHQTPPPTAPIIETPTTSIVDTPTVSNIGYTSIQSMFPMENFTVPWSAPPTQQSFMFPSGGGPFVEPIIFPSTPSPSSHPQNLAS